jgi:non-ribosomal peptide synthetase component F
MPRCNASVIESIKRLEVDRLERLRVLGLIDHCSSEVDIRIADRQSSPENADRQTCGASETGALKPAHHQGDRNMLNIATNLERNAELLPEKVAVYFGDKTFTYAQLNGAANQVANGLKALGIGKGDKDQSCCPNLTYFPIIGFGVIKARAVVVPINVLLKGRDRLSAQGLRREAFFCFEGSPELPMGAEDTPGSRRRPRARSFS